MSKRPTTFRRSANLHPNYQKKPNAGRAANSKIQLSFSSESSTSDDLPTITTASTVTQQPSLITDSESYSYYESTESSNNEVDWTSKNQSPKEPIQRQRPSNIQQPEQPDPQPKKVFRRNYQRKETRSSDEQIRSQTPVSNDNNMRKRKESNSKSDEESNYSEEDDHNAAVSKAIHNQINKRMNQPSENQNNAQHQTRQLQKPVNQPQNAMPVSQPPQKQSNNVPIDDANHKSNEINDSNEIQNVPNAGPVPEETYQIIYEPKKSLSIWKRHIQMTKNDILVYRCESMKLQPYGKIHVISNSKGPIELSSKSYAGMIVRHQSGYRFTLFGTSQHAMPATQIAGVSFIDLKNENANIRTFRVAIATEPYAPNGKENDLSRIAFRGTEVPGVKIFATEMPVKQLDGSLTLDMGPYSIIRSIKNFIIRSPEGVPLFTIFKTFDGICTVKIRPPFTPIIAYAISVAISTSSK